MINEVEQHELDAAYDEVEDYIGGSLDDVSPDDVVMAMYMLIRTNRELIMTLTSSDPGAIDGLVAELQMDMHSTSSDPSFELN